MTLGVRGIAQNEMGAVMLVRHTYTPGWHLPGGGVERGETAEEAMHKEFAEEAGIAPNAALQLFGIYLNPLFRGDHVVLFRCPSWQACQSASKGEILERGFFALDALPPGTTRATQARLREVFHEIPRTAHW